MSIYGKPWKYLPELISYTMDEDFLIKEVSEDSNVNDRRYIIQKQNIKWSQTIG